MSMEAVRSFLKHASAEQKDELQTLASSLVDDIFRRREENLTKLAELEGEVMVHSTVAHLGMFKENFNKGLCWDCGSRRPSPRSGYLRCDHCEAEDETP